MAQETKGKFNTVFMVAAFLAMGAFLYWLSTAAEPGGFAVAQEEERALLVSLSELAQNPAGYEGELLEVDGVEVQELLGSHVFLAVLPGAEPYLVRIDPALISGGIQVLPGDVTRLEGSVHMMTEEVLEGWDAEALFAEPQQRAVAAAASSFLLARELEVTGTAAADEEDAGEQD